MSDKVYDLTQLSELAGGSQEFIDSMVETFLEHTPSQLAELINSYKSGDLTAMGGLAHKIKPNIDLFGIDTLKDVIRSVERKGKEAQMDSELQGEIELIEKVLNTAFEQLKS